MTDSMHLELEDQVADEHALFGPELLSPEEASRLLARGPGRLVVFMGERGSRKTSLCLELYERQRHGGGDAMFAGSWTLLAFEQLAQHRRLTGAPLPAPRDELDPQGREILHLALSAGEAPLHLLLANLPGEVFRRLADNQISAADVPWLRRADKLVLVVDGERLCDAAGRSAALTRVRQLLERLRSGELPHPGARLALLVTKWDLVRADRDAVAYWEPREEELMVDLRALDEQATALRATATAANGRGGDGLASLRAWLLEQEPIESFDLTTPVWHAPSAVTVREGPNPFEESPPQTPVVQWLSPKPRRRFRFFGRRR
jgi:hypothetical protein